MLNNFRMWYLRNQIQITWFIIGWLAMGGLVDFGRGDYINAVICWGIALVNYTFCRK